MNGKPPPAEVRDLTWINMDAAARRAPAMLTRELIPENPGVYGWYRHGKRMYVGKADSLRSRVWGNHLGRSKAPTGSAFRRNVAEHLGYGTPAAIKSKEVELTNEQLAALREWIDGCEVAWLTCATAEEAIELERKLKEEFKPPLTKV